MTLYHFDEAAADRACRFFETQLKHFKGRQWAGKPFILAPWERKLVRDVFGWKREDGTRRFRTVYVEIPRKRGKTELAAGMGLYFLTADGEPGAEIYSTGAAIEQSSLTFDAGKAMIAKSPALMKRCRSMQYKIMGPDNSFWARLSGEGLAKTGKNIHLLICDEFHEWTTPSAGVLFESLQTSMGEREQPLTLIITTAGTTSENTLPLKFHEMALRSIAGDQADESFYAVIYTTDKEWDDEAGWLEANPSFDDNPTDLTRLRIQAAKVKSSELTEAAFRRYYLNQWVEQKTRWIDPVKFDAVCGDITPDMLIDRPIYLGLDLSIVHDFSALVAVYAGRDPWIVVPRLYIPIETAHERLKEHGTPIPKWIDDGFVIGTSLKTTDEGKILADAIALAKSGRVEEAPYDRFKAGQLTNKMEEEGIPTVAVPQTFFGMSAALQEMESRMIARTILFARNKCLRWMISACECKEDNQGNKMLVKPGRKGKYAGHPKFSIDGIVATVIAIARARLAPVESSSPEIRFV